MESFCSRHGCRYRRDSKLDIYGCDLWHFCGGTHVACKPSCTFAADTRLRVSYGVAGGRRYTALKD